MRLTLRSRLPARLRASAHVLQLHTPADVVLVRDVEFGRTVRVTPPTTTGDGALFLRWFADVGGAQVLLGCACLSTPKTGVEIVDIDGRCIGEVAVDDWQAPAKAEVEIDTSLIKAVEARARALGLATDDTFADFLLHLPHGPRRVPMLVFALHTLRIEAGAEPVALFRHWLRLARAFRTHVDAPSLLADVLAMPTHGLAYRFDYDADGHETDQWSSLWSFPDPHRAAFDCEDGSKACLEIFHVLCRLDLSSSSSDDPELIELQRLARRYEPHLGVVELKHGPKREYAPHCLLVLLPSSDAEELPTITVESTANASGAWHANIAPVLLEADRRQHKQAVADLRAHSLPASCARMPLSLVREQKLYGRLLTLVHAGRQWCEQRLFAPGTLASQVFLAPAKFPGTRAFRCDTSELNEHFAPLLRCMPRCKLPLPPAATDSIRRPSARAIGAGLLLPPRAAEHHSKLQALPATDKMTLYALCC